MTHLDDRSILNAHPIDQAETYRQQFISGEPFPHVVIDSFFTPEFAAALYEEFPAFERGCAVGDDGQLGSKSTFDRIRKLGGTFSRLDATIQTHEFLESISKLTGIPDLIYDPFYLGGGTHENREGQGLDAHIDFNYHPSERWHRRLNLIVYLNPEWESAWGGSLELFSDPRREARPVKAILPLFNRCVIFETSEQSWHGFSEIRLPIDKKALSRKSIALYFYTAERPAEQTAGRHSTVYVNRQLHDRFTEGYVLRHEDVHELKHLFAVRDDHIREQYTEIAKLLQAQDRGLVGHFLYLAKRAYVRLRR